MMNIDKKNFAFKPTAEELAAIRQIGTDQELSEQAVMRQALRCYQQQHLRLKAGETVAWSGDAQRAAEFAGPLAAGKQENEREKQLDALRKEIINTPETADFMAGVPIEAIHQRERWGSDHDEGKSPFDWFWLIGFLAQKAAHAAVIGDLEKAKHHTISTAAALANWHAALSGSDNSMRPGIMEPK
jgi:hypothetical protein